MKVLAAAPLTVPPIERLATPRASNGNGHGLGLPIVTAIAANGATFTAHARPERRICGGVTVDWLWHAVPSFPTVSEVWLHLLEGYGV